MTMPPQPEAVVDARYRLLERVGRGGMAEVWAAEDLQLGRRVALKLLHGRFAEDPEFVERFRREASSAAALQHPNVVSVYDRGEWDGTYYIAMEFLEGRSLKTMILDEAPVDPLRAIEVVVQILKAARFAHKRGVVHRDLKPQNVILDGEGRVKVTDFGIARAGASDMTETGSILGTAQYLSPEQAQGHAISPRSDLYSIGIILFELLTGRLPFEGDSAVTVALKQVAEDPVAPSTVVAGVPPDLDHIVLVAMAKDPAARFADADAFIAALESVRERLLTGADGDGTVAFVPPLAEDPADEDEDEEPRRRWPWVVAALAVLLIAGGVLVWALTRADEKAVPSVVGLQVATADKVLTDQGFEVRTVRSNDDAPRGEVFGQDPAGGEEVEEGATVTVRVSEGPPQASVPDVVGATEQEARQELEGEGFRVRVRKEASGEVDKGKVIRSVPAPGQDVDEGSRVTVVVSTGPRQVEVPTVVGNSQTEAESTLAAQGFRVTVREKEDPDAEPGTVTDQSPDGGTRTTSGASVTIVVATAPPEVEVPDLEGRTRATAERALRNRGLDASVEERSVDQASQDGRVVDQSPAGGPVRPGSSVTITVGVFEAPAATDETPAQTETTP